MQRNLTFARPQTPAVLAVLTLALIVGLAGCAPAAPTRVAAVARTRTPRPTFTPIVVATPIPLPTATVAPTATAVPASPTPAPTATLQPAELSANQNANVRMGPGTNYQVIGQLRAGDAMKIMAKNDDASWFQFNYGGDPGWVSATMVATTGDVDSLKVAQNVPQAPAAVAQPVAVQPPPAQPKPAAPAAAPAPPPAPSKTWKLASSGQSAPQCAGVFIEGRVLFPSGSPQNGVCIYYGFYGPRQIKCSGCGGKGDGNWGFSCTGGSCAGDHTFYVVQCPANLPSEGISLPAGSPPPAPANSDIFVAHVTDKCATGQWNGVTFQGPN